MIKELIFVFLTLTYLVCATGHPHNNIYEDNAAPNHRNGYKVYGSKENERVKLELYYESLCPDCMKEYPELRSLVNKMEDNIDLHTYPYGNAHMYKLDGKTMVSCQHGEAECYGNKLHACAIDILTGGTSTYVNYIACLMEHQSNDKAADTCGKVQNIDSEPIKKCAQGDRGNELLVYFGKESQKVKYQGVPYVRINGTPVPDNTDLKRAVCAALKHPPDECNIIPQSSESKSSSEESSSSSSSEEN